MAEVLTREVAIPKQTAPDGRRYGVFRLDEGTLWDVRQIRLDEQEREIPDLRAQVPAQFRMKFTSNTRAMDALRRFLIARWNESDGVRERTERKRVGRAAREDADDLTIAKLMQRPEQGTEDLVSAAAQG